MRLIINTVMMAAIIGLVVSVAYHGKKDPYSYRNIVMTSVTIFLIAIVVGVSTMGHVENRGGEVSFLWTAAAFLWRFSRGLFIPLCFMSLFMCVSNISLLRHEGYRWQNLLGFIFAAAYLTLINLTWFSFNSLPAVMTKPLVFGRLMLCYVECTILAICLMGYAVLRIQPLYDRDFVVILGCSVSKKGKLRPLLKGRVNRAIRFAWEQEWKAEKSVKYIPSGGQGSDEPISEGSAMELYLLSHGAEDYEVIAEKKSRNTRENLVFSKKIIEEQWRADARGGAGEEIRPAGIRLAEKAGILDEGRGSAGEDAGAGIKDDVGSSAGTCAGSGAKVAVVTTNYHVLRSGMLSRRAGLDAIVIGSGTKWYFWPNAFFREMVAIFCMHPMAHLTAAAICLVVVALM